MKWLHAWCLKSPALVVVLGLAPAVYTGTWVWCALAQAIGAWLCRTGRAGAVFTLGALVCLAWGWRSAEPVDRWPFAVHGEARGLGTVIAEAPVGRRGTVSFGFRVEQVTGDDWTGRASASVRVVGYRGEPPALGSRWSWAGRLADGMLVWDRGRPLGWEAPWWALRASARVNLRQTLAPLGPAPAGLAEALVIGATDDLTPFEKDAFRRAGCSHVLALSGMHLSLLALVLQFVLQRRAPPLLVFVLVQVTLGAFCFLAGPIPSLLRAWAMAFLGGLWALMKTPVPLRELLAQSFVVTLLVWPELAGSLSFQLSVLALAGLFWWAQPWDRWLRPWVGLWAAAQLGASAAALAATLPLTWALFGETRWVGLVMTPPLVALTTVHLLGAVGVIVLGVLGLDAGWAAPGFQALYDATFALAAWAARVPAWDSLATAVVVVTGGLGGGLVFLYNRRHRRAPLPVSLNYDSPAALQAFLDDRGFNALKRWGQNFLINAGARKQILAALELKPGEPVWEVGPGLGALTHHLVAQGHPLTVFEIDPGYAAFLRDEFGSSPGFQLVEGDVVKTWKTQPLARTKCVGNLPYNAASAIVADFVEGGFFPEVFVVTVQLEMAQRMTATPGNKNYSSFSVLCQSAFRLDDVVTLKPGSFYPAPEVTSRVVRLRPHGLYPGLDHGRFSTFVRECFSSRRKTLRNNLPGAAAALHVSDDALRAAFVAAEIDLGLRAEVLPVKTFVAIFQALERGLGSLTAP